MTASESHEKLEQDLQFFMPMGLLIGFGTVGFSLYKSSAGLMVAGALILFLTSPVRNALATLAGIGRYIAALRAKGDPPT